VEHKYLQEYDEVFQRIIGVVIFLLIALLSIAAILAIIWDVPLGLESQLVIP
jgi:hypothetical protein